MQAQWDKQPILPLPRQDWQSHSLLLPIVMSALGQKQTFAVQKGMSALPLKADMCSARGDVC
jgi:hypothetical protein